MTLEDLDIEIHLVKENQVISKDAKSQAKFIQGINLVVAKNYSDNLREEVKKGMREKASQAIYPGHAPFGYRNNKADRTIEIDPVEFTYGDSDDGPLCHRCTYAVHCREDIRQSPGRARRAQSSEVLQTRGRISRFDELRP